MATVPASRFSSRFHRRRSSKCLNISVSRLVLTSASYFKTVENVEAQLKRRFLQHNLLGDVSASATPTCYTQNLLDSVL
jgi:hypothetical protein